MEVALMIEGQNGLDWPRWKRLVLEAERLGFAGLYRSDHYTNLEPPERDSLELWLSLTWLADRTERLRFGPVVSPVTFRHPALTARMAIQVDLLSGGRLTLGLGAGWQPREHEMFGLDLRDRFERFEEALDLVARLVRNPEPTTREGRWYQVREAVLLPRPERPTPILVGGNGEKRTLPLAARYADEWNAVQVTPPRFRELNGVLDRHLEARGRDPRSVRRSLMHGITWAADRPGLEAALRWRAENWASRANAEERRERGEIIGSGEEILEAVASYEAAGVECLMLQWLPLDDLEGLEGLAEVLRPWLKA